MKEKELKEIAANYFGFTQTVRLPENLDVEVIYPDSLDVEAAKKIKIKWENHIGSKSGVSRITPLDIMHHLHMKYTKENYAKAVEILKEIAALNNLPVVRIGDKYLLINSKHRR